MLAATTSSHRSGTGSPSGTPAPEGCPSRGEVGQVPTHGRARDRFNNATDAPVQAVEHLGTERDDENTQIPLVGDASEVRHWVATGEVPSAPSTQSRNRLWEFVDEIRSAEAQTIHRLT